MTGRDDNIDDLIPARVARKIACCSVRTLRSWAVKGRIREFRREQYKERYYVRDEIEKLRPQQVKR